MVQAGDTIARRFVLLGAEDADLVGVQRYLATDTRLDLEVTVDIVTSVAPSGVIRAAQRARVLRDKRLTRVLAAGVERAGDDRVSYVVTERPRGVRVDSFLGTVAMEPSSASAMVGEATAALSAVLGAGAHHGALRSSSLTVTEAGRVVVSGLGVDGELATQAGLTRAPSERADALALAGLYLTAITGTGPGEATKADLPSDLPRAARKLCQQVIKGSGPTTLAEVAAALRPGDTRVLRTLYAEASRLWWPAEPLDVAMVVDDAVADDAVVDDAMDHHVAVADDAVVDVAMDDHVAVDDSRTAVPEPGPRPRTRFGGAVDDLDEFHDIVAEQNVFAEQSVAEALLGRLHERFPSSRPLSAAAEAAHRRATESAPLNAGPLLLALLIVTVFVATIVAASLITKPYVSDFDGFNNPAQTYPEFTIGQSTSPSPSPTP